MAGVTSSMTPEAMLAAEEADNAKNQAFTVGAAIIANDGQAANTALGEFGKLGNDMAQVTAK